MQMGTEVPRECLSRKRCGHAALFQALLGCLLMHPRSHCGGDTCVNWGVWCGCHHRPSPTSPVPRAVGFGDKFILLLLPCSAGALHLPAQGWYVGTWEVCGQFNRSDDSRGGKNKGKIFFSLLLFHARCEPADITVLQPGEVKAAASWGLPAELTCEVIHEKHDKLLGRCKRNL